jgi:prepilin-type processing-associated H-X9-DG protein
VGGRIGYFGLSEWATYFAQQRDQTRYRLDKIDFLTLEKDTARVKVTYTLITPTSIWDEQKRENVAGPPLENQEQETLDLRRETVPWEQSERWRIAPAGFEKEKFYRMLSLEHVVYYGGQRPGTLPQLRAEVSANRLKEAGLGVMQFAQDYDEQYLFQNDFWRDAIKPYVTNDSVFFIPGTQKPYTFNDNLSAKNMADLAEPARTVLFYEGSDEELVYRYNGKAIICYADGHVGFVSPKEVNDLIWKP